MRRKRPQRPSVPTPDRPPRVAIPVGDPGGIGPEVVARSLQAGPLPGGTIPVLVGGLAIKIKTGSKNIFAKQTFFTRLINSYFSIFPGPWIFMANVDIPFRSANGISANEHAF